METIFMNTEHSKMNESHKFILNLPQRLDLRSSNKHAALQNISTYDTWKNIRKQYKNNKLKIINDDKIVKPDENPGNVEEINIPLQKKDEILNKLRTVL